MSIQFTKAKRSAVKARIALCGPSGSGKTYTALGLACALSDKVAVIDTERGSASMYVGLNSWEFDTLNPQSFSPASLIEALGVAAGAGYGCVVVDSLSHYWMGVDGMLEQVDQRTEKNNSFGTGWKAMRPVERRMIDALVSYPGHVVVTLRTKTEYVIEKDDRGKAKPVKIGLKPEQRDGLEYEFSVVGDMDHTNTLTVSKTRLPMLTGAMISKPGAELAATIKDWLADGEDTPGPLIYRADALDPDATYQVMLDLHARVSAAGLLNAPVTDGEDKPTVLGALIVARGSALKPQQAAS